MTVALPCMAMGLAVYGDVKLTVYGDVPPRCDGHLAGDDFAGMVDSVRFTQTDVKLADFIHRADRSLSASLIVSRQLFLRFHASIEAAHSSLFSLW